MLVVVCEAACDGEFVPVVLVVVDGKCVDCCGLRRRLGAKKAHNLCKRFMSGVGGESLNYPERLETYRINIFGEP